MAKEAKSSWAYHEALPLGILNKLNQDITKRRIAAGESGDFSSLMGKVFSEVFSSDIKIGSGPYAAVVLDVLTGPQANNSASTKDRPNTKSSPVASRDAAAELRQKAGKKPAVTVIAKIPEFDSDIPWPKSDKDRKRIQLHGEFKQIYEATAGVENIKPGSIVWVVYANDDEQASYSGGPTGYIVGVHTAATFNAIVTKDTPLKSFNPICKAARSLAKPAGGIYVGNTDDDPAPGLIDMKIKNHIKTGIFGNGHPRTKAHFNAALLESDISTKHKLKGPAPGSNNAFIWIGHLKNNGYMDLLDRPNDKGRETIIYAPATLDLRAPVEIKYYFHGAGGFGAAHVDGPNMSLELAATAATIAGNDFREKIAPAIKDLNRDGRNYILVIPEMSYSRGYGTANDNLDRIEKLIDGKSVGLGALTNSLVTTVRTAPAPGIRGILKSYLSTIPVESGKTLTQNTPLRLRQLSTFDGSYTGGKFGDFHGEVLDVLDEYIYNSTGGITGKDEFVSFVADGLGAIALSSIVKSTAGSAVHAEGITSFKSIFSSGVNLRIDFITDPTADSNPNFYSSFFGLESPSSAFFKEFLLTRDDTQYTEFNYITSPGPAANNAFFDTTGKIEEYKKHSKKAGKGASAKKFSFRLGPHEGDQRFATLHVMEELSSPRQHNKTKVSYAFSMTNDFLPSAPKFPKKGDVNSQLKPGLDSVPDHAYALATKQTASDMEKLAKKQKDLEGPIKYFSTALAEISKPNNQSAGLAGLSVLCKEDSQYKIYCNDNYVVEQSDGSLFSRDYRKHLANVKKNQEITILLNGANAIEERRSSKGALEIQKILFEDLLVQAKENLDGVDDEESNRDSWNFLTTGVQEYLERLSSFQLGLGPFPDLDNLAYFLVAPEAFTKLITKIDIEISRFSAQQVQRPADCVPAPQKISEAESGTTASIFDPTTGCPSLGSEIPSTFSRLAFLLGYSDDLSDPPVKEDFEYSRGISKTKVKKVKLPEVFKLEKFQYKARGPNETVIKKESPPVWACMSKMLSAHWNETCEQTGYYPFAITSGVKGHENPNAAGTAATENGLSLHAFGLAIDIDPQITGYSRDPRKAVHSVFTGAWNPYPVLDTGESIFDELYKLGVYQKKGDKLLLNAHKDLDLSEARLTQEFASAPDSYLEATDTFSARDNAYFKIMADARDGLIVPLDANPVEWVVLFCEKTGMRWGNGTFLKKRWRGGKVWNDAEKKEISNLLGVENVVDRVQNISWKDVMDSHTHFQFWGGKGIVSWEEVNQYIKEEGS